MPRGLHPRAGRQLTPAPSQAPRRKHSTCYRVGDRPRAGLLVILCSEACLAGRDSNTVAAPRRGHVVRQVPGTLQEPTLKPPATSVLPPPACLARAACTGSTSYTSAMAVRRLRA